MLHSDSYHAWREVDASEVSEAELVGGGRSREVLGSFVEASEPAVEDSVTAMTVDMLIAAAVAKVEATT